MLNMLKALIRSDRFWTYVGTVSLVLLGKLGFNLSADVGYQISALGMALVAGYTVRKPQLAK